MATSIPIAVRGSAGISVVQGPPSYGKLEDFKSVESRSCRVITFSNDGNYLAYVIGSVMNIVRTDTWSDVATVESTKPYYLTFSPKSTYLVAWEPYEISKDKPEGTPNVNLYKSEDGEFYKGFVYKSQQNWEPRWSEDEKIFSRKDGSDILFYEDDTDKITSSLKSFKITSYSISPMLGTYYILCHTVGSLSGQPSFGRLFKYPNFDSQQIVASKSFMQADKVEYYWSSKGTHALLLTVTELDKTGKSYYGKQTLHFISTTGQTNLVSLSKEGPIYSVAWSPKGQEFCVIYGFMPAKATIFSTKCDAIFEMGSGPRNSVYYNPQGNILLLGGFGNLNGLVELWDINNRKLIGKCDATDSTLLEWGPDGKYFLTATTAPRLRIGNGYKIWHCTGVLVHEQRCNAPEELYQVIWKKFPPNSFKEPIIVTNEKIEGIVSKDVKASTQAYRPPSARNRPGITFNLHDDEEPARKAGEAAVSKAALKQRKKREARKARKAEEGDVDESAPAVIKEPSKSASGIVPVSLTGDPERDKKIKNIKKKLDAIEKLKIEQSQGKALEINQIAKIKGEQDLINDLKRLQP